VIRTAKTSLYAHINIFRLRHEAQLMYLRTVLATFSEASLGWLRGDESALVLLLLCHFLPLSLSEKFFLVVPLSD